MATTHYVVSVRRDRYSWPKLHIVIEARVKTPAAGDRFINRKLRELFDKRANCRWSRWNTMRVQDFRVVDVEGLKRLQAAAKASATIRRKRGAKKAAITRLRNRGVQLKVDRNTLTYTVIPKKQPTLQERMLTESKSDYYPAH